MLCQNHFHCQIPLRKRSLKTEVVVTNYNNFPRIFVNRQILGSVTTTSFGLLFFLTFVEYPVPKGRCSPCLNGYQYVLLVNLFQTDWAIVKVCVVTFCIWLCMEFEAFELRKGNSYDFLHNDPRRLPISSQFKWSPSTLQKWLILQLMRFDLRLPRATYV